MAAFILSVTVIGHVQHLASQQQLSDGFRAQLAEGTAPVSEGDVDDVLLADGAPVAMLEIPSIGVREVVVEGTDSGSLQAGPGHRRDTVLPGQAGVSVVMGRATAFGGPFARLQELAPGTTFTMVTGQGEQTFETMGVRYAGDPAPPALKAGESRLILITARGLPYAPTGVVRVDARLTSEAQPSGARLTTFGTLPASDRELATDTSTVWALVFALQFLLVVELAAVWSFRRIGPRHTWIVFVPVVVLTSLLITNQVVRLLPNLL
jgi:sortase A